MDNMKKLKAENIEKTERNTSNHKNNRNIEIYRHTYAIKASTSHFSLFIFHLNKLK